MSTQDTCCTIVPYFRVKKGQSEAFGRLCERLVARAGNEPDCLYYGWSFRGNQAHCRQGFVDAEGVLIHLAHVAALLKQALSIADLTRLEIHGPEEQLARLRRPLAALKPRFFTLKYGFRR